MTKGAGRRVLCHHSYTSTKRASRASVAAEPAVGSDAVDAPLALANLVPTGREISASLPAFTLVVAKVADGLTHRLLVAFLCCLPDGLTVVANFTPLLAQFPAIGGGVFPFIDSFPQMFAGAVPSVGHRATAVWSGDRGPRIWLSGQHR